MPDEYRGLGAKSIDQRQNVVAQGPHRIVRILGTLRRRIASHERRNSVVTRLSETGSEGIP